jgi:hypothetical protein
MAAVLLVRRRVVLAADAFAEIVIWRLPEPLTPAVHPLKYRLVYVVGGQCVVRYDNEHGKGDHRHWEWTESPYAFTTPERLLDDFGADVARWNREHSRA